MLGENFGVKKVQTINRRMFIIGAAKIRRIYWNNSSIIFVTNYREQKIFNSI